MYRFLSSIDCVEIKIESPAKFGCKIEGSPYLLSIMRLRHRDQWSIQWWKTYKQGLEETSFLKILDEANPVVIEELLYHIDFFGKETVTFSPDVA